MKPIQFRNSISIKNIGDFECICEDMLSDFLESFTIAKGLKRKPDEEDGAFGEEVDYIYTQKGMRLYDIYCTRLRKLAKQIFPTDYTEVEIESSSMIWP